MATEKLPPNVNAVPDRHGKIRYRYRRRGVPGGYLPGAIWSAEWISALAAFQAQRPVETTGARRAHTPFSMDDLAAKLRSTGRWKRQADDTRRDYGRIVDRLLETKNKQGARFGDRDARMITVASLERMLGKMSDRPGAAVKLRKIMRRLFTLAVKMGWRQDNPASLTDPIPQQGEGFHTWTDDEIEQYRAHHALGTTARLTLELALNTAARRCNLASLERHRDLPGFLAVAHAKGGEETLVEMLPETRAAIEALPSAPIRFLIVTSHGKPYSVAGLGNRFRDWADAAGLPKGCSLHGLRKAQARRLVEAGATNAEGRSVTGHKTDDMFNHYAAKADRVRLAGRAMAKLRGDLSNLPDQ